MDRGFKWIASKTQFHCDSFIVPLQSGNYGFNAESLVVRAIHWYSLFGLHKTTRRPKGIIQLDFESLDGDEGARRALALRRERLISNALIV
jgi:hypothetical protein